MKIEYAKEFDRVVEKAKSAGKPMRVAIAGADAENILLGAFAAQEDGFVEPVLVGIMGLAVGGAALAIMSPLASVMKSLSI